MIALEQTGMSQIVEPHKEEDLVDYATKNLKANGAIHIRVNPEREYESPELIFATNIGNGTTVYQGDNRFSLKDIFFIQNRFFGKIQSNKQR